MVLIHSSKTPALFVITYSAYWIWLLRISDPSIHIRPYSRYLDMNQNHVEKTDKCTVEVHPVQDSIDNAESTKVPLHQNHGLTAGSVASEGVVDEKTLQGSSSYAGQADPQDKANDNIVDWDGPDDPENPLNWSPGLRTAHIIFASSACLMVFVPNIDLRAIR
jgi:hypothetical protein